MNWPSQPRGSIGATLKADAPMRSDTQNGSEGNPRTAVVPAAIPAATAGVAPARESRWRRPSRGDAEAIAKHGPPEACAERQRVGETLANEDEQHPR
jgi:hypothetical protein